MTQAEIQTVVTSSPCVAGLLAGQLEQLKVILLWRLLSGAIPMTQTDIQTLFTSSPCVADLTAGQLQQLQVMLLWELLP